MSQISDKYLDYNQYFVLIIEKFVLIKRFSQLSDVFIKESLLYFNSYFENSKMLTKQLFSKHYQIN